MLGRLSSLFFVVTILVSTGKISCGQERPNVLFIAVDDLNDWIGCLGGHPQTITPNFDRLAKSSVLFTNAHTPGAACNPARTAILTGRSPRVTGLYDNRQKMRELLPDEEILPKTFSRQGYFSAGSGKLLHYFIDADSWDDYYPEADKENPFPRTLYPVERPLSLPRGGDWQYVETDWGPLQATDEEFGGDFLVANWISEQLSKSHEKPFFLACGFYRPHEPWFVPEKYFEPFPLESIQLPPGYQKGDLDDLPPAGKRRGPNRYFAHIQEQHQWKQAIQGYLASIHFADAMLGQVLDALESGPHAENTIVVLWSDHGWHLGEKEHWQKFTAWRACSRVPLMIRVPQGTPGLPQGSKVTTCDKPVTLLSLFPTLIELCGLKPKSNLDGPSLVPLLRNPESHWPYVAATYLNEPDSYGLSTDRWRYIHYANGDEELYNIQTDPYEWKNLAQDTKFAAKIAEMRKIRPTEFAPKSGVAEQNEPELLEWKVSTRSDAPPSQPFGKPVKVEFFNNSTKPVKMFVLDRGARPSFSAIIYGGRTHVLSTQPGTVYQICDGSGYQRGYFKVGGKPAKAIIPPE